MKRLLLMAAVAFAACDTGITVDPEGYACGPADPCPTGYACTGGKCHALGGAADAGALCATVTCDAPPPATCATGNVQRTFLGRCQADTGQCVYDPVDTTCASACVNGACVDRCAGVTCVTPPQDSCLDANTLHTWSQTGTCAASTGQCSYTATDKACANGCDGATRTCRNQNLCANVTCTTPPPPSCQGSTLQTPASPGTCNPGNGQCTYPTTPTTCPSGCANGQCVPPSLTFSQVGPRLDFPVQAVDVAPGSAGSEVLAVGPAGRVARWDGTAWTRVTAPSTNPTLHAVAFVTGSIAYVVGSGRTVWRYNQGNLSPVGNNPFGGQANLIAVHGRGDGNALISDDTGVWGRLTNGNWSSGSFGGGYAMRAAWMDEKDHERIAGLCPRQSTTVGPRSCVMHRSPGSSNWVAETHATETSGFTALGGAFDVPGAFSSDALVGFQNSTLNKVSTGFFSTVPVSPLLEGGDVVGLTALSTTTALVRSGIYALTSSANGAGHLYRLTRNTNGSVSAAALVDTFFGQESLSPNDSIGVIVAETKSLGGGQGVNNITRRGFTVDEALDLGEDWAAVSADAAGNLALVSAFGDLALKVSGKNVFEFHRGDYVLVRAAEGRAGTGVLVAGRLTSGDGALERYSSSGGVPVFDPISVSAPQTTFQGLCRVSDAEAWAVGTGGTIAAINGLSASLVTSGTQKDLFSVSCPSPGVAVACGQDGTVLRLTGGAWSPVTPPFPVTRTLTSCVLVGGVIHAAGDGVFARLDRGATAWTVLPNLRGLDNLVVRSPNEVYASASGTVTGTSDVARFDGTRWTTLMTVGNSLRGGMQVGAKVVFGGPAGLLVEGR